MVLEALRCFPSRPPRQYFMWLDFSGNQEFREAVALECLQLLTDLEPGDYKNRSS